MSLENDGNIKIGMSVSCVINIDELTDVLAVPINVVQINGDRRYVLVVENGETKEVDITTGVSNDEYVQVLSGLEGGEMPDFSGGGMPDFSGGMPSGGRPSGRQGQ